MIDSTDVERMQECWKVFGEPSQSLLRYLLRLVSRGSKANAMSFRGGTESIVADHRVEGVPTLVLANKQDAEGSLPVEEIKEMFNKLIVQKLNVSEGVVLPISALQGYDACCLCVFRALRFMLTCLCPRPFPGTGSGKLLIGSLSECRIA